MSAPIKTKSTFKCPDCGAKVAITSTKVLSRTYKEFYTSCSNDACGGRYVFAGNPIRVLTPSQSPNPDNHLPMHDHTIVEGTAQKEKSC